MTARGTGVRACRPAPGLSLCATALLGLLAGGCGSSSPAVGGGPTDADFAVCSGTPAVRYAPGMSVRSASGAYTASIESAVTQVSGNVQVPAPAIGIAAFTVAVMAAADGGVEGGAAQDAGASVPAALSMSAPAVPSTVPGNPWMPVHLHGGSTAVDVVDQGQGTFAVSAVDFFMGGYWQLYLDLVPAAGVTDRVTFSICIPDD
jgi:hypothetical protein